jgi:DNA invertase Pin-like site-specific DNA recombinase
VQKAFAYLRVSGKGQIDGDGFPRQLTAIKAYAAKHDIKIIRVFREEGVGGAKELENRPALLELMTALHSNGVKLVMVEKLDRLARDLMVQETIIGDLRKNGFDLVSVGEPDLLQNDPSRKLMRQIFGAISEYEKTMIVLKLRGARVRQKAKTGRCEGAKPYGELPGEVEVIERMKALRATGMVFDRIAAALNAEGIRPRRGARWHGLTVNKILTGKGRTVKSK